MDALPDHSAVFGDFEDPGSSLVTNDVTDASVRTPRIVSEGFPGGGNITDFTRAIESSPLFRLVRLQECWAARQAGAADAYRRTTPSTTGTDFIGANGTDEAYGGRHRGVVSAGSSGSPCG